MDTPKHVDHPRDFEPCQGLGLRDPAYYLGFLPANPRQYDCGQGRNHVVSGVIGVFANVSTP